MKRSSFTRESRLLGSDFERIIAEEGGKSAGLRLLTKGLLEYE